METREHRDWEKLETGLLKNPDSVWEGRARSSRHVVWRKKTAVCIVSASERVGFEREKERERLG